jgi:hypothetical protein
MPSPPMAPKKGNNAVCGIWGILFRAVALVALAGLTAWLDPPSRRCTQQQQSPRDPHAGWRDQREQGARACDRAPGLSRSDEGNRRQHCRRLRRHFAGKRGSGNRCGSVPVCRLAGCGESMVSQASGSEFFGSKQERASASGLTARISIWVTRIGRSSTIAIRRPTSPRLNESITASRSRCFASASAKRSNRVCCEGERAGLVTGRSPLIARRLELPG